jgi:hypothetical protein
MPVSDLLRSLEQSRFFGTVELKFEAGRVVLIRKTRSGGIIKIPGEIQPPTTPRMMSTTTP